MHFHINNSLYKIKGNIGIIYRIVQNIIHN